VDVSKFTSDWDSLGRDSLRVFQEKLGKFLNKVHWGTLVLLTNECLIEVHWGTRVTH